MSTAVTDLKVGDTVIVNPDGSARTIRNIHDTASGLHRMIRLAFDDGRVRLEPVTARYTVTDYPTRPEPRTHSVAVEIVGLPGRAHVYVTPGTMAYRDWYTAFKAAASFNSLADAQEWLVRVIGYEALDHEIHRRGA